MTSADVTINYNKSTAKYACSINGKKFNSGKPAYIEYMYRKLTGTKASFQTIMNMAEGKVEESVATKFDINKRFGFVEQLVKMVSTGVQASAIITGQGGLGKTYTVQKTLEAAGYTDCQTWLTFKLEQSLTRPKPTQWLRVTRLPRVCIVHCLS